MNIVFDPCMSAVRMNFVSGDTTSYNNHVLSRHSREDWSHSAEPGWFLGDRNSTQQVLVCSDDNKNARCNG